ncbi:MAG TPA: hypothetical protein DD618_01220, partial [Acholeplasmatales bacterium]|nr:hypothetical protein [Acholeplasmatales bacterium]
MIKKKELKRPANLSSEEQEKMVQDLKVQELQWYKEKTRFKKYRRVRLSRSLGGDIFVAIILIAFGMFSAYPLIYTVCNSLKGLGEIFVFP